MVALQKASRPPAPLGTMRVCSPRPPAPALAILHLSSAVNSCSYDSTVPPLSRSMAHAVISCPFVLAGSWRPRRGVTVKDTPPAASLDCLEELWLRANPGSSSCIQQAWTLRAPAR